MITTKNFVKYYKQHGPHFSEKLCKFAVSMMETDDGAIKPITKQELDEKLKQQNITLEYNEALDYVYVANMCKADFLGKSVPNDDKHLCQYVKDVIDDPDGYEGQPFNRWLADMEELGIIIKWSEFI